MFNKGQWSLTVTNYCKWVRPVYLFCTVRRAAAESARPTCSLANGIPVFFFIHINAAGNGKQWMNVRGWTCYTSKGQTAGDRLVDCLYQAAALWLPGHKLRKDNSDVCIFLESDESRLTIVVLHVEKIVNYVLKR